MKYLSVKKNNKYLTIVGHIVSIECALQIRIRICSYTHLCLEINFL